MVELPEEEAVRSRPTAWCWLGLHVAGAAAEAASGDCLFEEAEFEEVVDAHLDEVPPRAGLDGDGRRLAGCKPGS